MPILDPNSVEFFSHSPDQTRRVGMRLGALLRSGDVVCLSGDLGTGKTTLVQGITRGWGSLDPVTSPTFVLVNSYRRPGQQVLSHLDAYRLNNSWEAEDLDLNLMIEQGSLIIEWPERITAILPEDRLWVSMSWITDEQRRMQFTFHGHRYQELLSDLRRLIFGGS
jgi:tRNA threonylcarbamoyladenosine biosynthesis protein TsaE